MGKKKLLAITSCIKWNESGNQLLSSCVNGIIKTGEDPTVNKREILI
jgi:hypothetical protein